MAITSTVPQDSGKRGPPSPPRPDRDCAHTHQPAASATSHLWAPAPPDALSHSERGFSPDILRYFTIWLPLRYVMSK